MKKRCAIIGSGNIGTDLLVKIHNASETLEVALVVGIDINSAGLARARELGVATTHEGFAGFMSYPGRDEIELVFDATSARAHLEHARLLKDLGIKVVDLTPAALGPYVVPVANLDDVADVPNLNMVTCGGQATIPIVHAVSKVAPVRYAEIVASISSRSAGPGTRANIDEFTETTARGLEVVGGATRGKAIIVLNPAEPPLIMRDTVYCLTERGHDDEIAASVDEVVRAVQGYVPGYRLVQPPVFEEVSLRPPGEAPFDGVKVTVLLEVEGAGDFLPKYAGNLDIMTAAAKALGERWVA